MAETEYKFPYTAEQIENKLRQVGDNAQAIEQVRKEIPKTPEAVGARPATWMPNASEVGADASGTAQSKVASHNTSDASHNDIRLLIEGLTSKLNVLANSDDTTLDQMAEVVAYIKNNKTLIDGITTSKVNVSDIIDNLTSNVSNKPLSAKQGVALKALIDAIAVPTKTSQLQNDSGYLTQHQDLSDYAKKATTLAGYGITDAATKEKVEQLEETIADLTNTEDKVEYIVPTLTQKAYVSISGTVVAQSSEEYAYTEKIPVKEGQTIRAVVNSTGNGGKDTYVQFTTITAYVDGVAKSSLGVNGVGTTIEEYVVPESVTEVVVSAKLFKSAYSNQRIEITTPATNSLVSLAYIRNDYSFSLPKKFYLRNGETAEIFLRNLLSPNYIMRLGNYTDSTTIRNTDDKCKITGNAVANKELQYVVYDNHYNEIESGTMALAILGTFPSSQKMLMIGDSFISMGEIESSLRGLFTTDGNTLTLIGSKGSGSNLHEGYAGKKYTDFANGFSGSPFGESGFDFANYMSTKGYSGLNSVFIQLGTNDVSATNPNQDLTSVINAMKTIVNSIKSYDSSIKIYVGLTVMPNLDSVTFAETYNGIGWNWIMKQNMLRLNELIINEYKDSSNVIVVATNCILDNSEDIRDNVHPTTNGFSKMAKQLYYTMMS